MMQRLRVRFRAAADAVMVGYHNHAVYCNETQVLLRFDVLDIDVPVVEVRRLFEGELSDVKLPEDYCFKLTNSSGPSTRTVLRPERLYVCQQVLQFK
ncbi:unnamed protein product [Macrosiphum euphorbiae]|uniref:Uncharacterized protein n=1 Tax=Macrosiphum euphorbiae TaxID=13131 RepID=A0AAV0WEY6_9HEMI|nr:unnamed protein product [Macrosiphum euphorbiae]